MRVGVVDIGTNSTRLLVAEVDDGSASTSSSGGPPSPAWARALEASGAPVGRGHGARVRGARRTTASRSTGSAPSAWWPWPPARCATPRTAPEFRDEIERRFGIDARTISGDEEARLTFLGATAGRAPGAATLVIDIGGGSTEYVTGHAGGDPDFHVSTRMGSVRHTERHLHSRPAAPRPSWPRSPRTRARSSRPTSRPTCASAWTRASPSPAPPPRSPRSTRSSTPTTPSACTATASAARRASASWPGSPR